jgi:hypothetical protein
MFHAPDAQCSLISFLLLALESFHHILKVTAADIAPAHLLQSPWNASSRHALDIEICYRDIEICYRTTVVVRWTFLIILLGN